MKKFILKNKENLLLFSKIITSILGTLASIVAIIGFLYVKNADFKKKPFITFSNIPITFLIDNEHYGFYDVYSEQIYNEESFSDKFMIPVSVSNTLSNDMQLNKIYINIDNIKRDYSPYFKINSEIKEDGAYINICNCGWGDAEDITFIFECFDSSLNDYIKENTLNIYIEKLGVGESIEYPFILNEEINNISLSSQTITFSAKCFMHGTDVTKSIKNSYLVYYIYDGKIEIVGVGGTADVVYGISFDSNTNCFSYEREILEEVHSKEIMVIPICVYPDQTCTFDLNIKFKYLCNGKEDFIQCKRENVTVDIDSSYLNEFKMDINNIKKEDVYKSMETIHYNEPDNIIFSFPAINNFTISPRCPLCGNVLKPQNDLFNNLNTEKYSKIWYCENCNDEF